jgi:MFS family permease
VFGFFTSGIWARAPVWLPELFPTRMRGAAIAFCFNAPRLIGPLIAGALIVGLGGYGPAATTIGLFFILGFLVAPFLPETNGRPLPGIDAAFRRLVHLDQFVQDLFRGQPEASGGHIGLAVGRRVEILRLERRIGRDADGVVSSRDSKAIAAFQP